MSIEADVHRVIALKSGRGPLLPEMRPCDLMAPDLNRIVDMLVALERSYGCEFNTREIDSMVTVADLVARVQTKLDVPQRAGFW